MGAHIELQAIRAVLSEGVGSGLRAGIRPDMFVTLDAKTLWDFLYEWHHDKGRYGTTPSEDIVRERFQNTPLPEKADYPLATLVTLMREAQMQRVLVSRLPTIQSIAQVDPVQALQEIDNMRRDLIIPERMRTVDLADAAYDHIRQEMDLLHGKKGTIGVPFPWGQMTEGTGGACPGKNMFVMAIPKTGKTMVCLHICAYFYWYHNARIAVFCGKEMSVEDVLTILACMVGKIDLEQYWKGELDHIERARFLSTLEQLRAEAAASGGNIKSRLRIYEDLSSDLSAVEEALVSFQPDVAYYDALYASMEDLKWDKQSNLVSNFTLLGANRKVFMMASWQANIREAKTAGIEDQDDYAYTSNVMAKASLVMKLRRPPNSKYMRVGFPVTRKLRIRPFKINYRPGVDMGLAEHQGVDEEDGETPDGVGKSLW